MIRRTAGPLALLFLGACAASAPAPERAPTGREPLGTLPARFEGLLPCEDCEGIRYQLEVGQDRGFVLRRTYVGRAENADFDDLGYWVVSPDGTVLSLHSDRERAPSFVIESPDRLRLLDRTGGDIGSTLSHELRRTAGAAPIEPELVLRGMYGTVADAGAFTECLTRRTWPVAPEGASAALEEAYGKTRRDPAEKVLVTVEGRVALRPRAEGTGTQSTLVVERVLGLWPGEACGAQFAVAPLEDTYWKLVRLGGQPVVVDEYQREPHLVFQPEGRRLIGSGGCNRLTGAFARNGSGVTFGPIATTRMMCPGEATSRETAFLEALGRVRAWHISGEHLELLDAEGLVVARFEARPLE